MNKLNDIEGKLTNEVHQIDTAFKDFQKQILWLNIGNKPDLFNSYAASNKRLLIFTKSQQIISFLKYLFAIKPYMQFKNLNDKFGIIIQCRAFTGKINDDSLENIDTLLDWLAFVGCKIPILLYTNERLERNLRMKIATSYLLLKFSNAKEDIGEFLKNNTENMKLMKIFLINLVIILKSKSLLLYIKLKLLLIHKNNFFLLRNIKLKTKLTEIKNSNVKSIKSYFNLLNATDSFKKMIKIIQ